MTINEDKVSIALGLTGDLASTYDARELIKSAFDHLGSKGGGGRVDFAQAGGQDQSKIEEAFEKLKSLV